MSTAPDAYSLRQQIRRILAEAGTPSPPARVTPALPLTWPTAQQPAVVYYAYHSRPLPTGQILSRSSSPFLRIEVNLKELEHPRTMPMEPRELDPPHAASLEPVDESQLAVAEEALFLHLLQASGSAPPSAVAELNAARETYRRWLGEDCALAQEMRQLVPQFLAWVDKE
jgi:hypothetical protein